MLTSVNKLTVAVVCVLQSWTLVGGSCGPGSLLSTGIIMAAATTAGAGVIADCKIQGTVVFLMLYMLLI